MHAHDADSPVGDERATHSARTAACGDDQRARPGQAQQRLKALKIRLQGSRPSNPHVRAMRDVARSAQHETYSSVIAQLLSGWWGSAGIAIANRCCGR